MQKGICVFGLLVAASAPARAHHFTPSVPVMRVSARAAAADVQCVIVPEKPRAGTETVLAFTVTQHDTGRPVGGRLRVRVEHEAMFSRIVPLGPEVALDHDAGYPGEFTVRQTFPTGGLYRVTIQPEVLGASARTNFEIPVWRNGPNPYFLVPVGVLAVFVALAFRRSRTRRARA
jgi:hypothetical protein